ncbi:MAG: DUF362 domain-containing protein [Veillonellaceae bacterium]|nr:DUF362 domain-containing protein [Veillonellaceae bacterium]
MRILSSGRTATITFHLTSARANPEMSVGDHMTSYDSLLILTHFKGHTMGGFGGSNKNIGIGCVDGRIGKRMIHTHEGEGRWSVAEEELMERITESTKATVDHFAPHIAYVNVLRNMSVSCDYIRHATKDDWQALSAIEAASYPAAEGAREHLRVACALP